MIVLDNTYGPRMPGGLTVMREKEALYATDAYFWEGWEDLVDVAQDAALKVLLAHSYVLVRPDAIASRKLEPLLQWLRVNDYSVVDAVAVQLDRHQVRSLWQYQWNTALPERKAACDILMSACHSLLVSIRPAPSGNEIATRRFARQKGPADPKASRAGDLRGSLGHKSIMLSLVHSPDEPADLVREIAILLPERARKSLLQRMLTGATLPDDELSKLAKELYSSVPEHTLDLSQSLLRVETAARSRMHTCAGPSSNAIRLIEDIRHRTRTDWRDLFDLLDECEAPYDAWDRITIAGHITAMNHDNVKLLIPRAPADHATASPRLELQHTRSE
ncbi:nucleoside-diphosphate kinase [Aquabacterium sp. A7-Y]|uniref:nucleoside-diphosphate kinase n=1 Tax=Aquabacterium sp. A7-Y TaxID=1349605 RepID=UPI00223E2541|nr:nucleoside-diphosphate kinase [Aquabacterium sp. A7-Y]MCW7536788.1 nucleoside-diphosphate kinase [Aquabacterium sp. A7-Y]